MLRKTLTALAASALVAGVLAGPAAASKKPTKVQSEAITHAVRTTTLGGADTLAEAWYTVDRIRISSLSPSWALAWQTPTKKGDGKFQPAYFILIQPQGASTWTVVSLGTALVGCGAAPNAVIKDLTGNACPPGERVKGG
jgi:hypothetical protein